MYELHVEALQRRFLLCETPRDIFRIKEKIPYLQELGSMQ